MTTALLSFLLILLNALALVLNIKIVVDKIKEISHEVKGDMPGPQRRGADENLWDLKRFLQPKFLLLFAGYTVLFGFAHMLFVNLEKIALAVDVPDKARRIESWFYFFDFVGRLGGGLLIGLLGGFFSSYVWGVAFGSCVTAGVACTVLAP